MRSSAPAAGPRARWQVTFDTGEQFEVRGLTLVGRTRGKRFIALSGQERLVFDQNLDYVEEESARHKRKGEARDD